MQNSIVIFIPFLGKLGPKNQNCQFKLKFGTYTNLHMQNSMVMLTFSVLTGNTFGKTIVSLS